MNKLSIVISAYNEEKKIEKCLKSVSFADEIVFVDNSSTDGTLKIAQKYTKKIISQKNDPLLIDLQKNIGFKSSSNEWILSVDADEQISYELRDEIIELLKQDNLLEGYLIPRKNIIFGKQMNYTGWYPDHQLRLFKKSKGEFAGNHVHEKVKIKGEIGYLKNHIVHDNYDSIAQFLNKNMIIYAQNEAENLISQNYEINPTDLITKPFQEFISRFFARKGYKDGLHGLFLSLLMAASHLVVLAYVWERKGFKQREHVLNDVNKGFKNLYREFRFWINKVKIEDSKFLPVKFFRKVKSKI